MKQVRFVIIFILGVLTIACSTEKKATKAFQRGEYQNTINLYKKSNSRDAGKKNYFIAESYRLSNRLKEAEPFYEKAGGHGIDKDSVQFYYAQSLKANSKYDEAAKELKNCKVERPMKNLKTVPVPKLMAFTTWVIFGKNQVIIV